MDIMELIILLGYLSVLLLVYSDSKMRKNHFRYTPARENGDFHSVANILNAWTETKGIFPTVNIPFYSTSVWS